MAAPLTLTRVVAGDGGKIELVVPELTPGETVEVFVWRSREPTERPTVERPMGFLKDKVAISADFDEPLDAFAEYT